MATRKQMWESLEGDFDLLVVGGGITGCGIARDAAMRGLRVALVEMRDLAYGTSSRSSKLVHGGLRYLEQYEFSLVFEAVSERRILMDIAPHLVRPLGFLFPVFEDSRQPLWMISAGMWLYDGLSMFRSPKMHRKLSRRDVAKQEPALRQKGLKGAPLYYDCATDDARLTLENGLDAVRAGAVVATRAKVVGLLHDAGRLCGAKVRCERTGEVREVRASAVINASGPWTDAVVDMAKDGAKDLLRPTKGVHIVVDADKLPVANAVVCFHPTDGRVLFAIPWGDQTYIGTTDTDFSGDPGEVAATLDDVDYLINAAAHYFPDNPLSRSDVISTWAGLRPLIRPVSADGKVHESAVSREHQVIVGKDGLITIAGGKLTTYRRMAAEVVDTSVKLLRLSNKLPERLAPAPTDREPLPGAVGWPADDAIADLVASVIDISGDRLSDASARNLVDTYGMRATDIARRVQEDERLAEPLVAGRPEVLAQVDWAVEHELASGVDDVLIRRTQIYFRDADQGLAAVDVVAQRLADVLGWSSDERAAAAQEYRDEVALSRQWREAPRDPAS